MRQVFTLRRAREAMMHPSNHDVGVDVLGFDWQDAAGAIHGLGKGILSAFGAGAAGDALGKVWQDVGVLKKDAPPPGETPSQGGTPPQGAASRQPTSTPPQPPTDAPSAAAPSTTKSLAHHAVDVVLIGEAGALAWKLLWLLA